MKCISRGKSWAYTFCEAKKQGYQETLFSSLFPLSGSQWLVLLLEFCRVKKSRTTCHVNQFSFHVVSTKLWVENVGLKDRFQISYAVPRTNFQFSVLSRSQEGFCAIRTASFKLTNTIKSKPIKQVSSAIPRAVKYQRIQFINYPRRQIIVFFPRITLFSHFCNSNRSNYNLINNFANQ